MLPPLAQVRLLVSKYLFDLALLLWCQLRINNVAVIDLFVKTALASSAWYVANYLQTFEAHPIRVVLPRLVLVAPRELKLLL